MTDNNETPDRVDYTHETCGTSNTMSRDTAAEVAANPQGRAALYCVGCGDAQPATEFVWDDDQSPVTGTPLEVLP